MKASPEVGGNGRTLGCNGSKEQHTALMSMGNASRELRPALWPFSRFFEIAPPKRGGVRGRKGDPLQTHSLQTQGSRSPRGANWPLGLETTSVRAQPATSSQTPNRQCSLCSRRVIFDPVDGLSGEARLLGDPSNAHTLLSQHGRALSQTVRV